MKIASRDFLDQPYIRGWEYFRQSFKENSLQERVTKLAVTILLWTPFVNIGAYFFLKKFYPISPLLKLSPHLNPMSSDKKNQYANHSMNIPSKTGTWDYSSRHAEFGNNYERVALIKAPDRKGSSHVFDLRKVNTDSFHGTTLYCPFSIDLFPDGQTYIANINSGWLVLSHDQGAIFINRIDNFVRPEVHLGSALVQFAIEMSLKAGYEGKVAVRSTNGSAGFYYRLGFICADPARQKSIEEEYQNNKSTLDGGDMYLPPESIAIWKQKIAQVPIL